MLQTYYHVLINYAVPWTLVLFYVIGAMSHWDAAKCEPRVRWTYIAAGLCALLYATSYVWVALAGAAPVRSEVIRIIQMVSTPIVWIAAPMKLISLVKERDKAIRAASKLTLDIPIERVYPDVHAATAPSQGNQAQ